MSDPIEELNRLGDALEGGPMPLPASEIRARGDRIRRRKHAVIAGASAAVVAAVAIPVVALTIGGSDGDPDFTPSPSVSDPVRPGVLGASNLLTDADTVSIYGDDTTWRTLETYPGDGQATFHPCAQESLSALGASTIQNRTWTLAGTGPGAPEALLDEAGLTESIAEFPDAESADAAAEAIEGHLEHCSASASAFPDYALVESAPVEGVPTGTAVLAISDLERVADPEGGGYARILHTGVVRADDRIAILTMRFGGQDFAPQPMQEMLPVAAERLVLGNDVTEEPEAEGRWPASIPPGFPLTSGWPEDDGSSEHQLTEPSGDIEAMVPAGELEGCQEIEAGDPADRLTTRLSLGSSSYAREILLFGDPDEAAAYVDSVQDAYSTCEAEGPTTDGPPFFTTTVQRGSIGDESTVVTRASDGIGRMVVNVVRVGNAVAVDLASDEGPGDTVVDLATETRENLADVLGALNDLQGGGTSG